MYLNSEALRKIAKKHVKNLGQSKGYETYKRAKERTFSKHQKLDILMNETEVSIFFLIHLGVILDQHNQIANLCTRIY